MRRSTIAKGARSGAESSMHAIGRRWRTAGRCCGRSRRRGSRCTAIRWLPSASMRMRCSCGRSLFATDDAMNECLRRGDSDSTRSAPHQTRRRPPGSIPTPSSPRGPAPPTSGRRDRGAPLEAHLQPAHVQALSAIQRILADGPRGQSRRPTDPPLAACQCGASSTPPSPMRH